MGEGLKRAFAAAAKSSQAHVERDQIEAAFVGWWNGTVRHGMTASEAGRTFIDALDAAGLKITRK